MRKKFKVHGWDIALNHAGIVELVDGEYTQSWVVTSTKARYKHRPDCSFLIHTEACKDKIKKGIIRLKKWDEEILPQLIKITKPEYVGLEDYAYGKGMRAHQIGELGGSVRRQLYNSGAFLRLHDPKSIKMVTALNGNADKDAMEKAVMERFALDFSYVNLPPKKGKKGKKGNRDLSGDLADAYGVARFVDLELRLRYGYIKLEELELKEIEAFNRVTKAHPVNILARDFISNHED